jgi:hypothetical protein
MRKDVVKVLQFFLTIWTFNLVFSKVVFYISVGPSFLGEL